LEGAAGSSGTMTAPGAPGTALASSADLCSVSAMVVGDPGSKLAGGGELDDELSTLNGFQAVVGLEARDVARRKLDDGVLAFISRVVTAHNNSCSPCRRSLPLGSDDPAPLLKLKRRHVGDSGLRVAWRRNCCETICQRPRRRGRASRYGAPIVV
jgi:hypothetical protein